MHAVDRGGGQQGFGAGDEGYRERRDQQRGVRQVQQIRRFQPVDGFGQVGRHFHPFDLQRQDQAGDGGKPYAEQRTGDEAQGMRAQLFPQPHHGDRSQPE
ncbi:hypothetical protein D3C84_804110 [compost metagenome]